MSWRYNSGTFTSTSKFILVCITKFCRKPGYRGNYCHSCQKRRYKERHPERYAYSVLKNNAKRRKKEFDLTFDQFLQFVIKTNYMVSRGRFKDCYHIDRIDETKGYTIDNIQVITNTQNIRKFLSYNYNEKGKPCDFKMCKSVQLNAEDYPF